MDDILKDFLVETAEHIEAAGEQLVRGAGHQLVAEDEPVELEREGDAEEEGEQAKGDAIAARHRRAV